MILLGILDVFYWIFSGVFSLVVPAIPQEVTNILAYLFTILGDGFNFVYQVLVDRNIAQALVTWMLTVSFALFALDLGMKILHAVKLESKHEENG